MADHDPIFDGCRLHPTGLELPEGLPFERWRAIGLALDRMDSSLQWARGDWWNYGGHRYGERARAVEALDDLTLQAWADCGTVARRFGTSRRREVLSFQHHREVLALDPAEADRLLGECVTPEGRRGRSTRWLRLEVQRAIAIAAERAWAAAQEPVVLTLPAGSDDDYRAAGRAAGRAAVRSDDDDRVGGRSLLSAIDGISPYDDPVAEWWGPPTHGRGSLTAFRKIVVSFRSRADVEDFARKIGGVRELDADARDFRRHIEACRSLIHRYKMDLIPPEERERAAKVLLEELRVRSGGDPDGPETDLDGLDAYLDGR
jgi:hypothetical protein